MKLSSILVWSFLFVTLVGILSVSYFGFFNAQNLLKDQVTNNLLSDSQLIERNVERFLDAQERKIELIATQSELSNEELEQMTKIDPAFYDLFVIASNGTVIASSDVARIGLDRSNRSYFINARNKTYVDPVYFALVPKQYSISVSTPFHGGVLVGSMKIGAIAGDLISDRTGLGKTGESLMAFVNENGEVVYFTPRLFSDKVFEVVPPEQIALPMKQALEFNEELIFDVKDYRGVSVIAAPNYLERIGVGMVTKIDYSEAIGAAKTQLIKLSTIVAGVVLIFVLIIALLISFRISKPIRKLTEGVDSITKGDLSMQLEKSSIFEIQKLIDSLSRILATMKLAILRTSLSKTDMGIGAAVKAKENAEEKYKRLYETSNDAIMTIEPPTWNYTSGNPATLKIFNVKDDKQLLSLTPADLSPKYQPDKQLSSVKAKKMIDKAMKEGKNYFEWTHKRYHGENFLTNVLLSRVEENGKTYLQVTVRDLGEEKSKASKDLKK